MPELPEVETVARTLAPDIVGKKIIDFSCLNDGSWQDTLSYDFFKQYTPRIQKVARKGKLLLIYFNSVWYNNEEIYGVAFHLKMSGRLFYYSISQKIDKHTRLILYLEDNSCVFFDDARKFGYARFFTNKSNEKWGFWKKLAKDPLEINSNEFVKLFLNKKASIKSLLLQQDIISGIGNIYADEALFKAQILPQRQAHTLTIDELKKLHSCLVDVLEESIAFCGSSIKDYRTAKGDVGSFQNKFKVYGRAGESCFLCHHLLEKSIVAGRTTVFCPLCQK